MPKPKINNVVLENQRIIFRNFAGEAKKFNAQGDRNFCIPLDPEVADNMAKDGWNIKVLKPREEEDEPQPYIQCTVSYKNRPPRVVVVGSVTNKKTNLNEDTVASLDFADIVENGVDVILNPYVWEIGTGADKKSGIKAYVNSIYVTINESELDIKYQGLDEE